MENQIIGQNWHQGQKILFRFFFLFAVLYIFPFPIQFIPGANIIGSWYGNFFEAFVAWSSTSFLGFEEAIKTKPTGSGDTTFDFIQTGLKLGLAFVIGLVWTVLDRQRTNYDKLLEWLTVLVRYYLAMMMLSYGFYKVIQLQFPFPSLRTLVAPFGDGSPMGLAWKFMGYSPAYNFFTGMGEVVGGLLLFNRKTTTLGAAILVAVLSNVVMINICYDVPVKLFSSVLLLFTFFLIALDGHRLLRLFLFNQATNPKSYQPHFKDKRFRVGALVLKLLIVGGLLYSNVSNVLSAQKNYGSKSPKPPLYGIYNAATFVLNGDTIPPLLGDTKRWRRLIIDRNNGANIQDMNDKMQWRPFVTDTSKQIIVYNKKDTLNYRWAPDSSYLSLDGITNGDTISVIFEPFDRQNFLLVNRGFNWINEDPYNR